MKKSQIVLNYVLAAVGKIFVLLLSAYIVLAVIVNVFDDKDEQLYIIYNDKQYVRYNDLYENYNGEWYPLGTADIKDTGYFCLENESINDLTDKDKVEIKRFSDESLDMFFVQYNKFWAEDALYCEKGYDFPKLSDGTVEEIVLEKYSDDVDYEQDRMHYHDSDYYAVIDNEDKVNQIVDDIVYIKENFCSLKVYQMEEVRDFAYVYIKFENINALYYIGIFGLSDDGVVFDDGRMQLLYYLMGDRNLDIPNA